MKKIKNSDSSEEATTERPSAHRAVITIETKHKILASLPSRLEISDTLSFKASAQLVNIARFSLVYCPKWYPQYEINHKSDLVGALWIQWSMALSRESPMPVSFFSLFFITPEIGMFSYPLLLVITAWHKIWKY